MALGEDDAVLAAQRAALTKKPPERASMAIEKKRSAAAREGKNRFARSSVLKIKEVRLLAVKTLKDPLSLPFRCCYKRHKGMCIYTLEEVRISLDILLRMQQKMAFVHSPQGASLCTQCRRQLYGGLRKSSTCLLYVP